METELTITVTHLLSALGGVAAAVLTLSGFFWRTNSAQNDRLTRLETRMGDMMELKGDVSAIKRDLHDLIGFLRGSGAMNGKG